MPNHDISMAPKLGLLFAAASILLALPSPSTAHGTDPIHLPRPQAQPEKLAASGQAPPALLHGALPPQLLSNLLAAAYSNRSALTRSSEQGFSAPKIDIYVVLAKGVYRWNSTTNVLKSVLEGDHRDLSGNPDFVRRAPLDLVYVAVPTVMGRTTGTEFVSRGLEDSGMMAQRVFDLCDSVGLESLVRAWVNREAFAKALNLPPEQQVTLAQTVGYQLLAGSTVPRLPRYMTDIPQTIPAEILIRNAPKTARRLELFRSITSKMTMADVVRLCGIPDELQGSGLHIFIYHLEDGSIVAIGTGDLKVLDYANHITRSGGSDLLDPKTRRDTLR
jgi:phosphopantetheinyl transferase (holo-ACP synthase)